MSPDVQERTCPNCGHPLRPGDRHCSSCGQKQIKQYPAFREIVTDFLDSVLNLNSKLYNSLRNLVIPGQLTIEYFKGRRAGFYPPIRLFFISMLGFYTLMGLLYLPRLDDITITRNQVEQHERREQLEVLIDTTRSEINRDTGIFKGHASVIDSFSNLLKDNIHPQFDTAPVPPTASSSGEGGLNVQISSTIDSIPVEEIITLEPDSLIRKYQITRAWDKLMIRQFHRMLQDTGAMFRFIIGNTTWMLICLIPFLALGMKLFYYRRKRYYIEHVVFLFHYHAFLFVFLILLFAGASVFPGIIEWMAFLFLLGFLWTAMYRYYGNRVIKTTLKFFILLLFYCFTLILFTLITGFISFLIF